ncbi:hypothetical protein BS47DRAFT_1366956 [Hydnum rufescens UP504]|uniref:Uncharacterized protein n=1 Tax=Hydnum rufescens UP504 TaxID=1448309 RepID=A0A9P6AJG3_9AGAM|nr:hypothetical protein BS47DRAFT_1366956 [Hydnum rufescens UP504]
MPGDTPEWVSHMTSTRVPVMQKEGAPLPQTNWRGGAGAEGPPEGMGAPGLCWGVVACPGLLVDRGGGVAQQKKFSGNCRQIEPRTQHRQLPSFKGKPPPAMKKPKCGN